MKEIKEYNNSCLVYIASLEDIIPLTKQDKREREKEIRLFNQFVLQYDWRELAHLIYKQQDGFIFLIPFHHSSREFTSGIYVNKHYWYLVSSPNLSLSVLINNINLLYQLWSKKLIIFNEYGDDNKGEWMWTGKFGNSIITGDYGYSSLSKDLKILDYVKNYSPNEDSFSLPLKWPPKFGHKAKV